MGAPKNTVLLRGKSAIVGHPRQCSLKQDGFPRKFGGGRGRGRGGGGGRSSRLDSPPGEPRLDTATKILEAGRAKEVDGQILPPLGEFSRKLIVGVMIIIIIL